MGILRIKHEGKSGDPPLPHSIVIKLNRRKFVGRGRITIRALDSQYGVHRGEGTVKMHYWESPEDITADNWTDGSAEISHISGEKIGTYPWDGKDYDIYEHVYETSRLGRISQIEIFQSYVVDWDSSFWGPGLF